MNDNDLLIKIGGDTRAFEAAVDRAEKQYKKLYNQINDPATNQSRNEFKNLFDIKKFTQTLNKAERAAGVMADRVKEQINAALGGNLKPKEIERYYKIWEKEATKNAAREEALGRRYRKQRNDTIRSIMNSRETYSRRQYLRELKRLRSLTAEELRQAAIVANRKKSKYDNGVNWSGHNPLRTVAIYGAAMKIVYDLARGFKAVSRAVVDFDKMVNQNMGVLQTTRKEAVKLAHTVEALGIKYGTAFASIQDAMLTLGRAGVNSQDIAKYTESVLALAQITGDTLGESAEAVASYREVFRDAAKDVEYFGGKMAYIANETVLSMANFKIMGNYALSASKNMGMSYDSLMSLMGAMSKVGKQSSTIGTTVRRLGTALKDTSDKVLTAWRKMGFEQEKVAKAMRVNSDKTIKEVTDALAEMSDDKYREATKNLNVLMKDLYDTLRDVGKSGFYNTFSEHYVNAVKQAEQVSSSFDANIEKLKNRFLKLGTTIGIDVLDVLNDFIGKTGDDAPAAILLAEKAFVGFGKTAMTILNVVITGVGILTQGIMFAVAGLAKLGGMAGSGVGKLLGGMDEAEYKKTKERIKGLEKVKSKLQSSQLQGLQDLKDKVRDYDLGTFANNLVKGGDNVRAWGDDVKDAVEKAVVETAKLSAEIHNVTLNGGKLSKALTKPAKKLTKSTNGKDIGKLDAVTDMNPEALAAIARAKLLQTAMNKGWSSQKLAVEELNARIKQQQVILEGATKAAKGKEQYEKEFTTLQKEKTKLAQMEYDKMQMLTKQSEQAESKRQSAAKAGAADRRRALRDYEKMTEAQMKLREQEAKQAVIKAKLASGGSGNLSPKAAYDYKIKFMKLELKHLTTIATRYKKSATTDKLKEKAAEAYTKQLSKQLEIMDEQNKHAERFASSFDKLLGGDMVGGLQEMLTEAFNIDTIGDSLSKLFTGMVDGFKGASSAMDATIMSSVWGVLLYVGSNILGSFLKDDFKYKNVGTTAHEKGADIGGILEHMDWAMTRTMRYSAGMYDHLGALVRATGQASRGLIASGYTFGEKAPSMKSGFLGFSSKSSQTNEQGLRFGGVTAQDLAKMKAYIFESGQTTKSKFWGMSTKTKQWYKEHGAPDEVTKNIIKAYQNGIDAVFKANDLLQMGDNNELLKGFYANAHKINFQGMSQADIAQAIEGAIGSDLDNWITKYAGWVDEFAKNSETALETYMRVAYEFEVSQQMFADLGGSLTTFMEQGVRVSQAFIEASGGIEAAITNVEGYIENFYTDAEKQKLRAEQIMRGSGILPKDAEAYRKKIEELTRLAGNGNIDASTLLAEMLRQQQLYYDYYEEIKKQNEEIEAKREEALAIQQENMDREMAWQDSRLSFYKDVQNKIVTAYTGTLSYLNFVEKADFMSRMAQQQFAAGDTQGYFDSLGKQLEYEKKMALTKEEYALKFDSYISELQNAEPEKTTDDVVQSLEDLLEQNRRIEDAIANSSYQKTF